MCSDNYSATRWPDSPIIVPVNVYHHVSCAETYSRYIWSVRQREKHACALTMVRSPGSVPTRLYATAGPYARALCGGLDSCAYSFLHTYKTEEDMPMQGIVCISGTNRPDNYTAQALGIVVEAFRHSYIDPLVFDARTLSLAFPGHPDPGDGERLRAAIATAPGVILATPEYHGSFCAMTKLIIENLGFPSVLAGKPVGLVGVAAGLGPSKPSNN